jgi:hypothetical protein
MSLTKRALAICGNSGPLLHSSFRIAPFRVKGSKPQKPGFPVPASPIYHLSFPRIPPNGFLTASNGHSNGSDPT